MNRLMVIMGMTATMFAAACSHTPEAPPATVETVEPVQEVPAEEPEAPVETPNHTQSAIELLDEGKETLARAEIEAMLAANPRNAIALKLLKQIETDPVELLGERHVPHTVQNGETTSSLAQAFLGDALLFYALSRYNDLAAPNRLMAGQTLKIPDSYGTMPETPGETVAEANAAAPEPEPEPAPVEAAVASEADAAAANTLRLQALEQLNAGNSERAVSLLRRARALDSSNPNIEADFIRVQRIQATLNKSN